MREGGEPVALGHILPVRLLGPSHHGLHHILRGQLNVPRRIQRRVRRDCYGPGRATAQKNQMANKRLGSWEGRDPGDAAALSFAHHSVAAVQWMVALRKRSARIALASVTVATGHFACFWARRSHHPLCTKCALSRHRLCSPCTLPVHLRISSALNNSSTL